MSKKAEPIDKLYILKTDTPPLQQFLRNRHKAKSPLQHYDEETNTLRALRYATNHTSVFEEEQHGEVTLGYIVFKNGKLSVPRENPILQEFLDIHPLKGKVFELYEPEKQAKVELDSMEIELKAMATIFDMEADELESVAMAVWGTRVLTMKSSEIKRDVLMYAKQEPKSFLSLVSDDLTKLKGLGVRAVQAGLLEYKTQAFFNNDNVICKVPFDESDEYRTLARYFKTKEGQKLQDFLNSKLK